MTACVQNTRGESHRRRSSAEYTANVFGFTAACRADDLVVCCKPNSVDSRARHWKLPTQGSPRSRKVSVGDDTARRRRRCAPETFFAPAVVSRPCRRNGRGVYYARDGATSNTAKIRVFRDDLPRVRLETVYVRRCRVSITPLTVCSDNESVCGGPVVFRRTNRKPNVEILFTRSMFVLVLVTRRKPIVSK